ncbi:8-oxoguanine glycosylase ogg1 [Coemansia sp. RSA 1722]|nr:8-oxoguanine glycosylase ogg1 [Coemansia sp. RSA 486]KAJ2602053.1 8-oxoguanine glycosylase ogg1 [Coemansia sp. RSA 1722]
MVAKQITQLKPKIEPSIGWIDLHIPATELRLNPTLTCGQAFRWKQTGPDEYTCAIWNHVIDIKQTPATILYRTLGTISPASPDIETSLRDYFQLDTSLVKLCQEWVKVDPDFADLQQTQNGVRMLRQPVIETLFTFIASSNNNIKRITMLVDRLCQRFGKPIETQTKGTFYTFPNIEDIAQCTDIEDTFKEMGFGYRAKYYAATIRYLVDTHECPEKFLIGLRQKPLEEARKELLKLSGVGPKVADCICLMALDKPDAVPVDTHIWQVAQKRYVPRLVGNGNSNSKGKVGGSVIAMAEDKAEFVRELAQQLAAGKKAPSVKSYEMAQQLIIALFGPYAGWAQGMLFSSNLGGNGGEKQGKQEKKDSKQEIVPKTKRKTVSETVETDMNQDTTDGIGSRLRSQKKKAK